MANVAVEQVVLAGEYADDEVQVMAELVNEGDEAAQDVNVTFWMGEWSFSTGVELQPGEARWETWYVGPIPAGSYEFGASVATTDGTTHSASGGMTLQGRAGTAEDARPDLPKASLDEIVLAAVTELNRTPGEAWTNEPISVATQVRNTGDDAATFLVQVAVANQSPEYIALDPELGYVELEAGDSAVVTAEIAPLPVGNHDVTLWVMAAAAHEYETVASREARVKVSEPAERVLAGHVGFLFTDPWDAVMEGTATFAFDGLDGTESERTVTLEEGAAILSDVSLYQTGYVKISLARAGEQKWYRTDPRTEVLKGTINYERPEGRHDLQFEIEQDYWPVTVTAKNREEAQEKLGSKMSATGTYSIVEVGGEAATEEVLTTEYAEERTWKAVVLEPRLRKRRPKAE